MANTGLLDLFGIDPRVNRQRKFDRDMLERQIAARMALQKMVGKQNVNLQNVTDTNAQKKLQLEATLAWAKENKVSPDAIKTLRDEIAQLDATRLSTAGYNASTERNAARNRASMFGVEDSSGNRVSPTPGMSPTISRALEFSSHMGAMAPGLDVQKNATTMAGNMPLVPSSTEPGMLIPQPFPAEEFTGSGQEISGNQIKITPETRRTTVMQPQAPVTADEIMQAMAAVSAAGPASVSPAPMADAAVGQAPVPRRIPMGHEIKLDRGLMRKPPVQPTGRTTQIPMTIEDALMQLEQLQTPIRVSNSSLDINPWAGRLGPRTY